MKTKLLLTFLALGLGGAWLAVKYRVPWAMGLLLSGLGVYSLVVGTRMIITRRAEIPTSSGSSAHIEYHTGISAQIWGVLFLLFSLVIIALGLEIWLLPSGDPRLMKAVVASPLLSGLIMIAIGMGIGLYGATRLTARREAFRETRINRFEVWFSGLLSTCVALLLLAAGLVRMLAPGTLSALRDQVIHLIATRLAG